MRASTPESGIVYRELQTPAALEDAYGDWLFLFKNARTTTPFQSPDWLIPWWKSFGKSDLKCMQVLKDGKTIGIVPCFIYTDNHNIRRLCFLGTGISDYCDILAAPGEEERMGAAAFHYLDEIGGQWDECLLQDMHAASVMLHTAVPPRFETHIVQCDTATYLIVDDTVNGIRDCISKKTQRHLRHDMNALAKEGGFRLEPASRENLFEAMDELYALHSARWESRWETGVLDTDSVRLFYKEAARRLLGNGILFLYRLLLEGTCIAAYFTMLHGTRAYFYIGGFDPSMERFSPGMIALYGAIQDLIKRGARYIDFLRGTESYKYHWGVSDAALYQLSLIKRV